VDERVAKQAANCEAHHHENELLETQLSYGDKGNADKRKNAHQSDAGDAISPNRTRGILVSSRKYIAQDRFNSIGRCLPNIRGARRGDGSLYPALPEDCTVFDAEELEIHQHAYKLL
jgi:hypothetical protein